MKKKNDYGLECAISNRPISVKDIMNEYPKWAINWVTKWAQALGPPRYKDEMTVA